MIEWTTDLANQIRQALMNRPWNLVTYIHEKVYVKVVCTNCGYRMFHQMMRLGPFDAPPRSVKYIGEPSGGV